MATEKPSYPNKNLVTVVAIVTSILFAISIVLAYFKVPEPEAIIFSSRTFAGTTAAFWLYHILRPQMPHNRTLIAATILIAVIFGQIGEVSAKIILTLK